MWAARSGGARQRVAAAQASLAAEEASACRESENAYRGGAGALSDARGQLLQAESRLLLEQQNVAHLEGSRQSLGQRRERLETELQSLAEPDAAGMHAANELVLRLDRAIGEAQSALDALQLQQDRKSLEAARAAAPPTPAGASRERHRSRRAARDAEAGPGRRPRRKRRCTSGSSATSWPRCRASGRRSRIDHGWETAVESVLRERLHALELADRSALARLSTDPPPAKASLFDAGGGDGGGAPGAGLAPLQDKVHPRHRRHGGGALGDWFAGATRSKACRTPTQRRGAARRRAPGQPRGPPVHALYRQLPRARIRPMRAFSRARRRSRSCEGRCRTLAQRPDAAPRKRRGRRSAACRAHGALEQARDALGTTRAAEATDAPDRALKLGQAHERYRERSAQIRDELAELGQEAARSAAPGRRPARRWRRRRRDPRRRGAAGGGRAKPTSPPRRRSRRNACARSRPSARRRTRSSASASVSAKIAEIDNSVRMIDQQIERADEEVGRLTEELAVDPIPPVRDALAAAVEARIACEKTLADARDAVEAAAGGLRALEEERLQDRKLARAAARARRRAAPEGAGGADQPRPVRPQLREANADEARLAAESAGAPRPSALQGEITRLTQAMSELGAVNLAALEELASAARAQGLPRRAVGRPRGGRRDAGGRDPPHRPRDARAAARDLRRASTGISARCSRCCSAAARRS